jgi:adenine nucleotide transporter 17
VLITNPVWVINTRITTGRKSIADDNDYSPVTSPASSSPVLSRTASATSQGSMTNSNGPTSPRVNKKEATNAMTMLLQMIREDGVLSLWQGVGPALILVANPAIQYMVILTLIFHNSHFTKIDHIDFK